MQDIYFFLFSFGVGVLWYRVGYVIMPGYIKNPFLRRTLKLQWHHFHHGVILTLLGIVGVLVKANDTAAIILLGVGLGFIVDEFFLFLHLETNREEELRVYQKTLRPTMNLLLGIIVVVLILAYLNK